MRRISVVGSSGVGKSTTAATLSNALGLPHLELDGVFHQPNWQPLPGDQFRSRVADSVAGDAWVVDGNYTSLGVNDIVWDAADTLVWLDYSKPVVMSQVSRRAISRAATKKELWNGNTESWSNLMRWDPESNIVRWSWTRFESTRAKYESKIEEPRWSHLDVYRLVTRSDTKRFLQHLESGG
ncbi:MAG: hypothetical protein ACR2N2_12025 [Acidimicrobiia bacterium]